MVEVYAIVAIIFGGMLLVLWSMLVVAGRADEAAERAERTERAYRTAVEQDAWERELAELLREGE